MSNNNSNQACKYFSRIIPRENAVVAPVYNSNEINEKKICSSEPYCPEVIKISDDTADLCKTLCRICYKKYSLSSMRQHTLKQHNLHISRYKQEYGNFHKDISMIIDVNYHKCHLCGKIVLLDNDTLGGHIKNVHRMSEKDYKTQFMTPGISNNKLPRFVQDDVEPSLVESSKKTVWHNTACEADACLQPSVESTWLNCDYCGLWFHENCIGCKAADYPNDMDFYCNKCYPIKVEEYKSFKEKLLIKFHDLANAQKDFGGRTVNRNLFKERKKANQYNFNSKLPATLRELCFRISDKYKTIAEFKYESMEMVKQLQNLILDVYESDLQFIAWELNDAIEDLQKSIDEDKSDVLGDQSFNNLIDNFEIKTDTIKYEFINEQPSAIPSLISNQWQCQLCTKVFSDSDIRFCDRKHFICMTCQNIQPDYICPMCYQIHGDKKILLNFLENYISFQNESSMHNNITKQNAISEYSANLKTVKSELEEIPLFKIGSTWSLKNDENSILNKLFTNPGSIEQENSVIKSDENIEFEARETLYIDSEDFLKPIDIVQQERKLPCKMY